jgi:hypothetical protein
VMGQPLAHPIVHIRLGGHLDGVKPFAALLATELFEYVFLTNSTLYRRT